LRIGASGCGKFGMALTADVTVAENRYYPGREYDFWQVADFCLKNNIYQIINLDIDHSFNFTEHQWRARVEQLITDLEQHGFDKSKGYFTVINEPMKYVDLATYANVVNITHDQVRGRYRLGAGNEEYDLAMSKGNMYEYICQHANFEVLDVHIQSSCTTPQAIEDKCNWFKSVADRYGKQIDCNESNWSDVATLDGFNIHKAQLYKAKEIGCPNFCMVFIALNNVSKYKWLSFIYNGVARSPYWQEYLQIINAEKQQDEIPIEELEDMKLSLLGLKYTKEGQQVKWLQDILLNDYGVPNPYGIDGKLGKATDKQIRDYQEEYGLKIDGIVGEQTTMKLINESSDPKKWMRNLQIYMAYE